MYRTVVGYMQDQHLIKPGDKIVAGVSGGADSMALLHILHRFCTENGGEVVAAHLNHGLRREALQDEQLVRQTCSCWGISCYTRRVDIAAVAACNKQSWEEAGRECRYQYFHELAHQVGADRIATAHHQNDQAESVLLHLLRGSGIRGLQGIKPVNGNLIRPLLGVTRQDIEQYVQENELPFCQDLSNDDPAFTRNQIRLQLIPYLQEAFNPRIIEALNRLAATAQEENAALDEIADQKWSFLSQASPTELKLNVDLLSKEPVALQNRLIRKALQEVSGQSDWSREDLLRARSLLDKPGSNLFLEWGNTVRVAKVYDALVFSRDFSEYPSFCYPVAIPGCVYIRELTAAFSFEVIPASEWQPSPDQIGLDLDCIKGSLCLRSRQEGDRLRLRGLNGHKSLKKYFMEQKIPARHRNRIPLLAAGEEIYAVLGYVVTQLASITASTERILVIKVCQDVKTTEENCFPCD